MNHKATTLQASTEQAIELEYDRVSGILSKKQNVKNTVSNPMDFMQLCMWVIVWLQLKYYNVYLTSPLHGILQRWWERRYVTTNSLKSDAEAILIDYDDCIYKEMAHRKNINSQRRYYQEILEIITDAFLECF